MKKKNYIEQLEDNDFIE